MVGMISVTAGLLGRALQGKLDVAKLKETFSPEEVPVQIERET